MSIRSQLQGFFIGAGLVGAVAMYQLQKDVWSSHRIILDSVRYNQSIISVA
jgi:hypothetical protein